MPPRIALALLFATACTKSGHVGEAKAVGSAGSAGSAASPSTFDDKLALPKQPARPKDQQARVDAAATALRAMLTKAKGAKVAADLCADFKPLRKTFEELQKVTAPKGKEEDFSSERDALLQQFDGADSYCSDAATPLDVMQTTAAMIRDHFVTLVSIGG